MAVEKKDIDGAIESDHPGVVLRRDFLDPLGLSANGLALALRVPAPRITEIIRGRRGVSADTALRLARYFETSGEFWLAVQAAYDLARARAGGTSDEVEPRAHDDKAVRKALQKAARRRADDFKERL